MVMVSLSPRRAAKSHTEVSLPSTTLPMMLACSATYALSSI